MKYTSTYLSAVVAAAALALVFSSCPNACSGHGTCEFNDMCSCQSNWAGNDCSLRVCPADVAHVTAAKGDNNADGDLDDNSFKRIPSVTGTVAVAILSDSVTMSAAIAGAYSSLKAGDGVIINEHKFTVKTHTAGAATFTLDRVYPGATDSTAIAYKFLKNQAYPEGTFESWPGHFVASEDQGHFYMECSNRGLCDRKAGTCKCFPGYEGTACQRTVCPNDCSGHGTCEKVSELATQQPSVLACTTLGATRGATAVTTAEDCSGLVSAGDSLLIGDETVARTVASAPSATTITLSTGVSKDIPSGARIAAVRSYGLWDADKNRACKCDARYQGYDCSERKCPYGDDTLTGSQNWETQVIDIGGNAGAGPAYAITGSFKLVFTDMFGEKWTTAAITVDNTDRSTDVKAALKALPNDVVQDVTVTALPTGNAAFGNAAALGIRYHVKFNGGTTTTATGNSGDLPAMECDTSALVTRMTGTLDTATGSGATVTFGTAQAGVNIPIVGDMLALFDNTPALLGDVTILSQTTAATVFVTTAHPAGTVAKAAILRKIAGAECVVTDVTQMRTDAAQAAFATATVVINTKTITLDAAVNSKSLAVGDRVRLWTSATVSQIVTVSAINAAVLSTVETITTAYAGNSRIEFYGKGSMEAAVCSNRGLCDSASGVCKCFKGYTMDDCSRQSALAM